MKFGWQLLATAVVGFATAYAAVVMLAQNPTASNPAAATSTDDQQEMLRRDGNRGIRVHDPSTIVKCKDEFWVFATGTNTPSFHSKDLEHWVRGPRANANPPAWVKQAIPRNRGNDFWAPDIIHVGDKYLLFYAASSFGKNTSAIGVAMNPTLDPTDAAYQWTDGGIVVQSKESDDFNALDPAAFLDKDGKLWLSFGSFWSGIKLIELDPVTGLRISPDSPMVSLAHWDSIEAPYIYLHDGRYYLFVNLGLCCRGVNSTYRICVGRAGKVTGPYLDKNGKDMLLTGGTILLDRDGPFIGPGHAGIIEDQGKYWFSCHFYDGTDRGISKLSVRPLTWGADGWPVIGKLDDVSATSPSSSAAPLEYVGKIELAGGAGRLDHFGLDADHQRLFASNRGGNTLDVVDLQAGKLVKQIPDQKKIRGIAYAPELNRIFVGDGDPGVCNIFDGKNYELLKSLPIPNADNVQFDPRTNLVFVGHDGLTVIDANSMAIKTELAMPGTLKAIRLDTATPRLYANSTANEVCVVDTDGLQVVAQYKITSASGNAALAVDAADRRLFVGCRKDPKLIVLDADTGREITNLDIPGNVDDLSFDAKRGRIYASSGEGVLAVVQQIDADHYSLAAKLPTAPQAQTSLFDPGSAKLYLGLPRQEAKDGPEIWIYQACP